jgi:NhaP-type Na+/H+ or K+/H+ antiporter
MGVLVVLSVLVFGWSIVSGRLERLDITGPIVFVVAGVVLCNGPWALVDVRIETEAVHLVAETTLILLLFGDAARVAPGDLRRAAGMPVRLLAIGLPLTIAAGFALAAALFTDLPWELAALLGAVLAPTDAALSAAVVSDESLPVDIRRSLNVESGLNDGIATPAVTTFIAGAATVIGVGVVGNDASGPGLTALVDIVGGVAIGIAVGYLGGRLTTTARARDWIAPGGRRVAVLMLALASFAISRELDVNYFVAAFVAGLAFRAAIGADDEQATELPELLGRVLSLAVWFVFGAVLLLKGLETADWRVGLYAVASLTVIRIVPVLVALIGSGTDRPTALFVGWFGPRGLASVVFGLLIVEELPANDPAVKTVLATIACTVVLSVVAHGITGRPLSARLARHAAASSTTVGPAGITPPSPFGHR